MVIMIQDIDIQQLERQYSISSYNSAKDEADRWVAGIRRRGQGEAGSRKGKETGRREGVENRKARDTNASFCCIKNRRRPTLPQLSSTIGSPGLNYSVRNGKR